MKNLGFILVFSFIPYLLFCQRNKVNKLSFPSKFIRFEYGLGQSELVYNKFQVIGSSNWEKGSVAIYNIQYGIALKKNFALLAGIGFKKFKMTQTDDFGFWSCEPEYYGAKSIINSTRHVILKSIVIPINLEYHYKIKNFSIFSTFGLINEAIVKKNQNVDFLLDNGVIGTHPYNDITLIHNRKYNLGLMVELGLKYNIFDRFVLRVAPFYNYNLGNDEILEKIQNTNIKTLGISTGAEYILQFKYIREKRKKILAFL
ncbi:MAG: hypothetical protein ACM3PT_04370 [Deltaproteobacteria bacterium]